MSESVSVDHAARDAVAREAMARVDHFFDGVFAPLDAWIPGLIEDLRPHAEAGLTGLQLATIVESDAHRILDFGDRPIYGAGFCASDALVTEGNPLAWWQGPEKLLLASSTFGPGKAAIDLERLEWYRVPRETGERHSAGPFVDYLCSNEVTITSTVPVTVDGSFWGVVCADVLVGDIEEQLLERGLGLTDATLVNLSGRVVVSSSDEYETGDRYRGAQAHAVRSERYPFVLYSD